MSTLSVSEAGYKPGSNASGNASGGASRSTTRRVTKLTAGPEICHPRVGKVRPANGCFPASVRSKLLKSRKNIKCKKNDDRCLLESSDITSKEKEQIGKYYLRPARPIEWEKDPDQWLDSNNIGDVMKQYEEAYSNFKFLGVLPIDFAAQDPYSKVEGKCLVDTICHLNIKSMKKSGIIYLGVVYNLDPHNKDGSHWVANFVDLKRKKVYYFDSYGMKAPSQIAKFMRSLKLQDPSLELEYNARRFQFNNSECGMYSLYFIISMLEGVPFSKFCKRAVPDGEMLRLRHWIFS
jgi:hypothetical protein